MILKYVRDMMMLLLVFWLFSITISLFLNNSLRIVVDTISFLWPSFSAEESVSRSLKYWYGRNKVDVLVSKSVVWDEDAASGSLDCAKFWVQDLSFVKSLSGYWKFFLVQSPTAAPPDFHNSAFQDSTWKKIPATGVEAVGARICIADISGVTVVFAAAVVRF
ncbi:glycoside hydrolase family 2 protein [Artemisia annua]|uniref:Glycoside hydrolase family 2 protein n=1 Tax=Artemisia annua TaxID=35608 RepID=A0A2U1P8B9_ARTAN|nr:glycoside hydrolase family 2 protein [Artemisia annua]